MQYHIGYAHSWVKTTFFKRYADESKLRSDTAGNERFCFYWTNMYDSVEKGLGYIFEKDLRIIAVTTNCFVTTEVPQFHERHLYPQRNELILSLREKELDKFLK